MGPTQGLLIGKTMAIFSFLSNTHLLQQKDIVIGNRQIQLFHFENTMSISFCWART